MISANTIMRHCADADEIEEKGLEMDAKKKQIRNANTRTAYGIRSYSDPLFLSNSISASIDFADQLLDPFGYVLTGAGMDAPEEIPIGSIKAFFTRENDAQTCIGFCQRTVTR